jgi:hypothetical protein
VDAGVKLIRFKNFLAAGVLLAAFLLVVHVWANDGGNKVSRYREMLHLEDGEKYRNTYLFTFDHGYLAAANKLEAVFDKNHKLASEIKIRIVNPVRIQFLSRRHPGINDLMKAGNIQDLKRLVVGNEKEFVLEDQQLVFSKEVRLGEFSDVHEGLDRIAKITFGFIWGDEPIIFFRTELKPSSQRPDLKPDVAVGIFKRKKRKFEGSDVKDGDVSRDIPNDSDFDGYLDDWIKETPLIKKICPEFSGLKP